MAQQDSAPKTPARDASHPKTNISPSPLNRDEFVASVRESYYHPDDLSGLDCKVTVDWPALFAALKTQVSADRLKALQNLMIHVNAPRSKTPEFTFEWGQQAIDTKEQLESGLKQMVGGFYQMYWPVIASFPIKNASEINKIEPQTDGGSKIYLQSQNTTASITTNKEHTPIQFTFETPAVKATSDFGYTPSPNPVPGDIRRLTSAKVSEQIGSSIINLNLDLDYQSVGGFFIPQHVTFALGNAYSIRMEFSSCAVSREIIVSPDKKPASAAPSITSPKD